MVGEGSFSELDAVDDAMINPIDSREDIIRTAARMVKSARLV